MQKERTIKSILHRKKKYVVSCLDVNTLSDKKFDLIISSMVIEHILDNELLGLFNKLKNLLSPNGLISLVTAGMKYWSIEDDIAGHIKRYEEKDIIKLSNYIGLKVNYKCGLTFPVSNLLLPFSSKIISNQENWKKDLSQKEKTISSSSRDIVGKTHCPSWLIIILNEVVIYPLYLIQRVFKNSKSNIVLYFELK